MSVYLERIPSTDPRCGRHVAHDPRSLRFLVAETDDPQSKTWRRYTPILNQGQVGSCTGNALIGAMGTGPLYGTTIAKRRKGLRLDEAEAVATYSLATNLDPWQGVYPPTDTGTAGLYVAKAAQQRGLITSYQHITSLAAAHNAIKTGPFITGTTWYSSMDTPDNKGLVTVSGSPRGGHEYEVLGYSLRWKLWKMANSWGPGWGKAGYFYMSDTDYAELLSQDGDATVLTP